MLKKNESTAHLFAGSKEKKALAVEEQNSITKRENDVEMDLYEDYIHKLNLMNGIGVKDIDKNQQSVIEI